MALRCVSAPTVWADPQSDVKAIYVARGLLHPVGQQSEISKYLYSIRFAPVSSVGSLGSFQMSKVPVLLLLDTQIFFILFLFFFFLF